MKNIGTLNKKIVTKILGLEHDTAMRDEVIWNLYCEEIEEPIMVIVNIKNGNLEIVEFNEEAKQKAKPYFYLWDNITFKQLNQIDKEITKN